MFSWMAWTLCGSLNSSTGVADGEGKVKICFASLQHLQMGWELPGQGDDGLSAWHRGGGTEERARAE